MIPATEVKFLLKAAVDRAEHIENLSHLLTDGLLLFDENGNVHTTAQGRGRSLVLPAAKD